MYRYRAYSLVIDSQVELPELRLGRGDPDVTIRIGCVDRVLKESTIDDEVAFPRGVGGFRIRHGREILVDLLPEADAGVVQTLLTGRIMGYLLRQRGYLPLHASAVCIDGTGVLFIGESGTGKSTTAAAFYSRGHDVLADDVSAIRSAECGVELQPAGSGLRLLEDSRYVMGALEKPLTVRGRKYVYRLKSPAFDGPCPVKRIYALHFEDAHGRAPVRSSALTQLSAVALLNTRSLLRFWRAGHAIQQINLDRSAAIAEARTVCRLIRPRSLNYMPGVVEFVEKDIQDGD